MLVLAVAPTALGQTPTLATVTQVVDGDTFTAVTSAGTPLTVRLIGIDAPELTPHRECGAGEATAALRALVEGRSVTLIGDPTQGPFDAFGRTLAYVDVGGVDAGLQQLIAGRATVLVVGTTFQRYAVYEDAKDRAVVAGAGSWGPCSGSMHRPLTPSPQPTQEPAVGPSRAESAERFVRRFYFFLSQRRFSDAWGMLGSRIRRKLGAYSGWRAGFRRSLGTKVNELSVSLASGRASVRIAIRSRDTDACNGREVRQFFRGRWVLSRRAGWWVATTLEMRKVGGGRVRLSRSDCAPKRPSRAPAPRPSGGGGGGTGGGTSGCHPSYTPCVPNTGGDVDCGDLPGKNYRVIGPDVYGLDGNDNDGLACES